MKKFFFLCLFLNGALTGYSQPRGVSPGTQAQDTEVSSIGRPAERTAGMPTGIARINGTLYYVRNNQGTVATAPLRVGDELRLERNGDLLLSDGRLINLVEGQMVTVAGTIIDAPRHVELPKPIGGPDSRRVVRRPIPRADAAQSGGAEGGTRRVQR